MQANLTADDMCRLAADLVEEHGSGALSYAQRAVLCFEAEGANDRARFWFTMCVMLGDLADHRINPMYPVTLN